MSVRAAARPVIQHMKLHEPVRGSGTAGAITVVRMQGKSCRSDQMTLAHMQMRSASVVRLCSYEMGLRCESYTHGKHVL